MSVLVSEEFGVMSDRFHGARTTKSKSGGTACPDEVLPPLLSLMAIAHRGGQRFMHGQHLETLCSSPDSRLKWSEWGIGGYEQAG